MIRFVAALGIAIAVVASPHDVSSAHAQSSATEAKRPWSIKPTPPEKIKTLKPVPYLIGGGDTMYWLARPELEGSLDDAQLVGIADGWATFLTAEKYWDLPLAELREIDRAAIERVERLLAKKEIGDERSLLGSWGLQPPAKDNSNAVAHQAKTVVTGSEMILQGGPPYHYILDATKTPHVIRWEDTVGIYELNGDLLRVCFSDSDAPPPTTFDVKPGQSVFAFRRLPDVMTLPVPPTGPYDPEVKAALDEVFKLWDAEKYDALLERVVPPEVFKTIPPEKLARIKTEFAPQKQRTRYMLNALRRIAPKISDDGRTAEFDLSQVHADYFGVPTVPITMRKLDGRWYPFP